MLQLDPSQLIGRGSERSCYIHPQNSNRCIKINHSSVTKQSANELEYFSLLQKRRISWRHLPKFYGTIQTNLGEGMEFDLIQDADGNVSKTLAHYLKQDRDTRETRQIVSALTQFRDYLLEQHIMVRDPNSTNFALQKLPGEQQKLILIDGIGNANFAPLLNRINYFIDLKIRRKWKHFERSLVKKHPEHEPLRSLLQSSARER